MFKEGEFHGIDEVHAELEEERGEDGGSCEDQSVGELLGKLGQEEGDEMGQDSWYKEQKGGVDKDSYNFSFFYLK